MKSILHVLLVFAFTTSFSQTPKILGTVDSIYSKILNEERKIFVYIPEQSNFTGAVKTTYPVVYLLDPENHFNTVTGMINELSRSGILPEMIVIGITNTDRTRDLTPTHVGKAFYHDNLMGWNTEVMKTSGGLENFTAFIEKELMPHVDSLYPTTSYHLFIGHSFGGLAIINTLFNHSELFNSYIAIDPSFWWDNQKLVKQTEKDAALKKFNGKTLFLGIANVMPRNMDTLKIKTDTSAYTMHTRSNFQFNDALKRNKQNNLKYSSKYYGDDNHGSVPLIATYDGLRFIFNRYKLTLPIDVQHLSTANLDSILTEHYGTLSKELGYTFSPPLLLVNSFGYNMLTSKNFKQAYKLFQKNIDNYPSSYLVYDGMGDYYKEVGNKEKAIEYYKKTLSLFDYPETKSKLAKLEAEK